MTHDERAEKLVHRLDGITTMDSDQRSDSKAAIAAAIKDAVEEATKELRADVVQLQHFIQQNAYKVTAFDEAVAFDHVRSLPEQNERLRASLADAEAENKRLMELLRRISDCDWLPEHDGMSVHEIARAALGEKP